MAVLRYLAIGGHAALTFATTHHGELKMLKYSTDETAGLFENASVEFDDVAMKPTYRLVWGIPGRSNALAIAERLGLDDAVISQARQLLIGGENDSVPDNGDNSDVSRGSSAPRVDIERMIRSLETDKLAAEAAREEAEAAREEIVALRSEVQRRLKSLQENERKLREEQRAAIDTEVKLARKEIARVIKSMQQGGGSAQTARIATEQLEQLDKKRKRALSNLTTQGRNETASGNIVVDEISVGDRIVVKGLSDEEVEVVEKISNKEVLVAMGRMRLKVRIRDVVSVRTAANVHNGSGLSKWANKNPNETGDRGSTNAKKKALMFRTSANSIDVRGDRVEQAISKIDQALDRALGMGALWIIHGHGTGKLRTGVRNFLKEHSLVSHIEDAEQIDGGTGVTIAYL